ncbi:hypothetical protein [endosymbiont GvMRE of Glomus versiforme]|uniref:hypothetical protein n=1 Tax=endosymbiont GvMRE of Glomus versiforme TaxID=2039283 RepID=UPI0011C44866|nr:hypothetical protein [endosymbiont GvMRE of Glomus versiforme]
MCDWDEVIQPHEPYALWLTPLSEKQKKDNYVSEKIDFSEYFKVFWEKWSEPWINYSPYGSYLAEIEDTEKLNQQQTIKNSLDFYQKAPFLTIAKELLKLIKEDKVEQVIFLSAYDKRKFPDGDPRKKQIFNETFGKFPNCALELIGFDNEEKGRTKADWIKENTADFDLVIDDNPNICRSVVENIPNITVCSPHYPAAENQHHDKVLLIKTSVSDLKKNDFNKKTVEKEK